VEALGDAAAAGDQERRVLGGLDALGDDVAAAGVRQAQDRGVSSIASANPAARSSPSTGSRREASSDQADSVISSTKRPGSIPCAPTISANRRATSGRRS
jgi:hypothetical protein